jgi:rubrerythrin
MKKQPKQNQYSEISCGSDSETETTTTTIQKFLAASKKAGFFLDPKAAAYIIKKGLSPDWIDGDFNFPEYVADRIKTDPKYKDKPTQELKRLFIKAFQWPDFRDEFPQWRESKMAKTAKDNERKQKEEAAKEKRNKQDQARSKLPQKCDHCGNPLAPENERGNCPLCGWEYAFDEKSGTYRFNEQRSLSEEFRRQSGMKKAV